ncbi:MAG: ATP phosphoribosyltransferase regulatory subunit, partial [Clostridia bacterium]|nr:ATP phosphoribosyltransferase regulatory subunit [Clostridia bacterium]
IDFSVINDMSYYNGIVIKGFISGIPQSILSGGQYDLMMQRSGRRSGAIGFAIYLDLLEELTTPKAEFDIDTVLLYEAKTDLKILSDTVRELTAKGLSVTAQKSVPEKLRYRQLLKLKESEVEILETHA